MNLAPISNPAAKQPAQLLMLQATRILRSALFAAACTTTLVAQSPTPANQPSAPAAIDKSQRYSVGPRQKHEAEKMYLAGAKALDQKDLESARTAFSKAELLDPANQDYSTAEQIARANLVTQLIQQSDTAETLNRPEEARAKLLEASTLEPDNASVLQHLDPKNMLGLQAGIDGRDSVKLDSSVALQPNDGRHSFHLHANGQDLLRQVLTAYGVTPSVDPSVESKRVSFDADEVSYAEAAHLLQLATDTFFVSLDPKRILVAKDTKANRDQFTREIVETVYLPGLSPTELTDMGTLARTIFDAQQSNVQAQTNTLIVRAPQAKLTALNKTLSDLLDGRSQLDLEIRLIEIDTSRTRNVGVQTPQSFGAFNVQSELQSIISSNASLVQQIVASGLAPAGDLAAIAAVLIASGQVSNPLLSAPFAVFGNGLTLTGVSVPGATGNLALNSSDSRMLEDVHVRMEDQGKGTLVIGEKFPIQTSSYSGLTNSSVSIPGVSSAGLSSELAALGLSGAAASQQAIPQVQYQDIGLNLDVTPRLLRSNDISLNFDLKIQALAGAVLNNIPELTNREFQANLMAKPGESTVFISDLTRQESKAISGIPGISDLPGFGSTTDLNSQLTTGTLLIIITPTVLRRDHTEVAGPAMLLPRHE